MINPQKSGQETLQKLGWKLSRWIQLPTPQKLGQ
jgi:hypothetical protein